MRTFTLHTPDFKSAWRVNLTQSQATRLDNGHLVSIGLVLGEDVQPSTLKRWVATGKALALDPEKANHSGCQSRCILRGDAKCQW